MEQTKSSSDLNGEGAAKAGLAQNDKDEVSSSVEDLSDDAGDPNDRSWSVNEASESLTSRREGDLPTEGLAYDDEEGAAYYYDYGYDVDGEEQLGHPGSIPVASDDPLLQAVFPGMQNKCTETVKFRKFRQLHFLTEQEMR